MLSTSLFACALCIVLQHNHPAVTSTDGDAKLKEFTLHFASNRQSAEKESSEEESITTRPPPPQQPSPPPPPPSTNPFSETKYDPTYEVHKLCGPWNSGGQTSDLVWYESADKLMRIIGNGVVRHGYNMFLAPGQEKGTTTNVSVAIYIESLSSFRSRTMDFEMDIYLAIAWLDRRLSHDCTHPILVTHKFIAERLWTPDIYFPNSKKAYFQEITSPNSMIIIYPDGLIFKAVRIDVTLSCALNLHLFPMDTQQCPIYLQSYSYVESLVNLTWHVAPPDYPIARNPNLRLNDMIITRLRFERCDGPYTMFRGTGNWSCIQALIVMRRLVLFHLIQTYIPSGMLVAVSWITFWLDAHASPARISLTITSLLTLTTMSNGARQNLPEVSYVKAMDLWLVVSQALIFLVLLEYAFVSYFVTRRELGICEHRRESLPLMRKCGGSFTNSHGQGQGNGSSLSPSPTPSTSPAVGGHGHLLLSPNCRPQYEHHNNCHQRRKNRSIGREALFAPPIDVKQPPPSLEDTLKPCKMCMWRDEQFSRRIDRYSRVVFPSSFILFTVAYWLYYSWYLREEDGEEL